MKDFMIFCIAFSSLLGVASSLINTYNFNCGKIKGIQKSKNLFYFLFIDTY